MEYLVAMLLGHGCRPFGGIFPYLREILESGFRLRYSFRPQLFRTVWQWEQRRVSPMGERSHSSDFGRVGVRLCAPTVWNWVPPTAKRVAFLLPDMSVPCRLAAELVPEIRLLISVISAIEIVAKFGSYSAVPYQHVTGLGRIVRHRVALHNPCKLHGEVSTIRWTRSSNMKSRFYGRM